MRSRSTCPRLVASVALLALACGGQTGPNDGGSDAAPEANAEADSATNLSEISAGNQYACAVAGGRAVCWGLNLFGAVDGVGATTMTPQPVVVAGLPQIRGVVASALAGYAQSCAVTADSHLYCWGSNYQGQIGNGVATIPATTPTSPTLVSALPSASTVACGNNYTCAASASGEAYCWGSDWTGQLGLGPGDGGAPPDQYTPLQVSGLSGVTAIATDDRTTCAIASGSVWCWGANDYGQVGDGTMTTRYAPVKLSLSSATSIALGEEHACAVASGAAYCWGRDDHGQLGDGKSKPSSPTPALVNGLNNVVAVTAGEFHTCALTEPGAVWCWGDNEWGNLGDGTVMTERDVPVAVIGLPPATAISAGAEHTCALLASGDAMCWGDDTYGELGDGVADGGARSVPTPVAVVGLP